MTECSGGGGGGGARRAKNVRYLVDRLCRQRLGHHAFNRNQLIDRLYISLQTAPWSAHIQSKPESRSPLHFVADSILVTTYSIETSFYIAFAFRCRRRLGQHTFNRNQLLDRLRISLQTASWSPRIHSKPESRSSLHFVADSVLVTMYSIETNF